MMVACWYGSLRLFVILSRCYQYCISGTMNNIFSNGNHKNDNNTTAPFSSLSVDANCRSCCLVMGTAFGKYIRYVIHNRTHTTDINTTIPSFSLSVDAVTVAVAFASVT